MRYDKKVIDEFIGVDEQGQRFCRIRPDSEDILYILNRQNSEEVDKAILFAVMAHRNQVRKGTNLPYIIHPLEVGGIVARIMDDNEIVVDLKPDDCIAAALLHDVIEDTSYIYDDLAEEFNVAVADLVNDESEDKMRYMSSKESWKIRKENAIAHLKDVRMEAKVIALGDKLSNMRMSVSTYDKRGAEMWAAFNQRDSAMQEWYYRSIAEILADLSEVRAYQEYLKCLNIVFGDE